MIIIVINCRRWKVQNTTFWAIAPYHSESGFFSTCNRVDVKIHLQFLPFYKGAAKWRNYRRGTQQSFIRRGSAPRSNPSHLYTMFDRRGTPLICLVCSFYRPKWQISVPTLNILQLVKLGSRPFIIHLTPEKGTPFREEPRRIGHCREYLPAFFLTQPIMAS